MEGVSFSEEQPRAPVSTSRTGGIAGLVIRLGIAKDEREATMVLVGTVIVALLVMAGIWFFGGSAAELPPPEVVPGTVR